MSELAIADSTAVLKITPEMAEQMKATMKKKLKGTEFEDSYDVDQVCDCVINAIGEKFTIKEMRQKGFKQTDEYKRITDECLEKARKSSQ